MNRSGDAHLPELSPDDPRAWLTRGNALRQQGRLAEAIVAYREAVACAPLSAPCHQHLALALLENGEFAEGWQEYEWRWQSSYPPSRRFAPPVWSGEAIGDRVLLLHAEQGFGDTIQFCRYAPLAAERARVVLEAPRALLRLLSGLPGVERVVAQGDELPPFDMHCPLLSLPRVFATTPATIPDKVPYLAADAALAAAWRDRLRETTGLRVGLVWAANPEGSASAAIAEERRGKSMALADFAPLAAVPGVSFVSLQKGAAAAETRTPPAGLFVHDWTGEIADFADTAALIEPLDLVITVDTAVVHLAGAMAKPVWLLNRFEAGWLWPRGRRDSPWYPSLRQFRQAAPGDWGSVLAEVRDALEQLAIAPDPDDPIGHFNLGLARLKQGGLDAAAGAFRRAITLRPEWAQAHSNLGVVLVKQGRTDDAVTAFRRAVELRGDWVEAHANLGGALKTLGDIGGAFGRAAAMRPDDPSGHFNLGLALLEQQSVDQAIAAFRRAVALKPDLAEAYNNLGVAAVRLGNLDDAVDAFRHAVSLRGDLPGAHLNLGNLLRQRGDVEGAIAAYRQALALQPDYPVARFALSLALLARGEYEEGWREYEWRWLGSGWKPPEYPRPRWEGQDVAGKTVLLYTEQGFGDAVQFVRYVPLVARRGARVVVGAPQPLKALFGRVEGVAAVCGQGEALPDFDYHCPLMSLPLVFDTRVESIPAAVQYLRADPGKAAEWRRRLAALPGLWVGLVWAGGPRQDDPVEQAIDERRSMTLDHFAALADVAGAAFVSLQKGEPAGQTRAPPPRLAVHDWTGELADFEDTAALVEALDLVISVDTAVAHLAGALGKPVWLLNRFDSCWRWLLQREDSPWYPSLRQFRQPRPGDWESVVARVRSELTYILG
jgi:Flp pilus assembly protein TadD